MKIKSYKSDEVEPCREASKITATILDELNNIIKEGVSTSEIDDYCLTRIQELGGTPAPLFYRGFPKSTCTSLNHVICHGIPNHNRNLQNGDTYIEVKSVTLSRKKNLAEFPDAVTSRGSKHLIELSNMSKKGGKCFLIYLIQRNDVDRFSIAKDLDNEYYEKSLIAKKSGVQFRAFKCNVSHKGISITGEINIDEN